MKKSGEAIKKGDSTYRGPGSTLGTVSDPEAKKSYGGEGTGAVKSSKGKGGKEVNSQLGSAAYGGPGRHL